MIDYYILDGADLITDHGGFTATVLRDQAAADDHDLTIDALVASGDCFVTLATQLDELDHEAANPELESVIRNLLYLQRHYAIHRKPSSYRQ